MDARDCLQILREIKDLAFATVDEFGRPQVRIIDAMLVEDERLYFLTARGKDFYAQLVMDGNVAVTGLNKDWQSVRLCGKARRLAERKKWIDRMFRENPSMEEVYPGESREILEAFVIEEGEVELFDLGVSPICRRTFPLGAAHTPQKGFRITEACITCGQCVEVCPQEAITETGAPGTGFSAGAVHSNAFPVIRQEHCLHCGLCFESCPVGAIVRRNGK